MRADLIFIPSLLLVPVVRYKFPLTPGHEGVGVITLLGSLVRHLRLGQRVGLGVYRGACGACMFCANGQNNLCSMKELMFMNGSHGAFAEFVRIRADFALPIPDAIATEHAGPLMCAGVTTFAPFRRHNIQSGQRVGVLGIGGLGHLAVQISAKWGCETIALSTSHDKAEAAKQLGAHRFVNIMQEADIKPVFGTLDYLLVTAGGDSLDYRALLGLLASNGKLIVIGVSFKEQILSPVQLLVGQKSICGSAAGSTGIALDMLRFCAVHGIKPVVESFPFSKCNEAVEKVTNNKVSKKKQTELQEGVERQETAPLELTGDVSVWLLLAVDSLPRCAHACASIAAEPVSCFTLPC